MNKEIENWIDYHKGQSNLEVCDFYTFFMEKNIRSFSDDDYDLIFQFFPNKKDLIERFKNYLKAVSPNNNVKKFDGNLEKLVRNDLLEKKKLINDEELLDILNKGIVIVEDENEVIEAQLNDEWHGEFISLLGDEIRDLRNDAINDYALFEAYYGLTHDYQLVWYLGSPLIEAEISLDNYYNIWKVGGDYAVTEDVILVSQHKRIRL